MRGGALARRPFRLLLGGRAISSLGDRLVPVALAVAVLRLTGSPADLGIVFAAQSVPLVALVLVGGVWADRLPRQLVMLGSDAVRALAQGGCAVLLLTGHARVWELAALQAIYGAAEAFFGPASTAVVPQTVASEDVQQANALMGLSENIAAILGPALAGVVVALLRPGWALGLDGASFILSGLLLARLRLEHAPVLARTSMLADLRAGWKAFRSRTWLWVSVLFFTLYIGAVFSPYQVLAPQVAIHFLGGAGAWAAINVALGIGAFGGGLAGLRLSPLRPLRASFLLFLASSPFLLLIAARAPLAAILAMAFVDGAAGSFFNALWFTAQAREVPAAELSRVSSWDYLGTLVAAPVGLIASGPIAAAIGLSATLYGAGGLNLALLFAVLAVPAVRNFVPTAVEPSE